MPLFTVSEKDVEKPRLIEAKSREAALAFVLGERFKVEIVTKPAVVAKLYADGVVLEDSAKPPVQEQQQQQQGDGEENREDGGAGDGKDGAAGKAPGDGAAPPARSPRGGAKATE